jgi:integrase
MKYLANFKMIVLLCVKRGWLQRDPFYAFKFSKREVDRQALTETEMKKIWDKDMGDGRLALVKDIFLFCCYTGLAYADIYKLKRTEISEGIDGGKWITTKRQKTDNPRDPLTIRHPCTFPAFWQGWGIKHGQTYDRTFISDIAPTSSALLHILPPSGFIGKVIGDDLK